MMLFNIIFSPVFIRIIINSINASILILAIFVLRFVFRNKINIKMLYFLWLILIVRLLLPFDLPLFNSLNSERIPEIQLEYSELHDIEGVTINENINISTPYFSYLNIFTLIWLLVIVFFLIKRIMVLLIFLRKLKNEEEISDNKILTIFNDCMKKIRIRKRIKLIRTSLVKSPCVFGFFKNRILIPEGLLEKLDQNEIKCIFFHELSHLKNKDTKIEIIIHLLKIIYFFNPLVILAFNQMIKDCEYFSDELSISLINEDSYTYGNTLIKVLDNINKLKLSNYKVQGIFSMLAADNNKKHLKRRIKMICTNKKRSVFFSIISLFFLLVMLGFTFTMPAFAETKKVSMEINFINPLDSSKISARFGKGLDPIKKDERFHDGIDLPNKIGTPVKVSFDGTVVKVDENGKTGYGKYIIVHHNNVYSTLYAKLNKVNVKENQVLKTGDIIGFVGNTGRSTGPHLHFEIRKNGVPVNPEDHIIF